MLALLYPTQPLNYLGGILLLKKFKIAYFLLIIIVCLAGCSRFNYIEDSKLNALELPGGQSSALFGEIVKDMQEVFAVPSETFAADFSYWQDINSDVCAIISISEYEVYEPVIAATESNNQWLRTAITGEYSVAGSVFLDVRCDLDTMPVKLVHGHNMPDGSMFGNIPNYLNLKSCTDAPLIEFYTEDGILTYQVFSVMSVNSREEALPLPSIFSLEEVTALSSELLQRSLVPDGIILSQDILILNTCWYGESGTERNLHCIVSACRI